MSTEEIVPFSELDALWISGVLVQVGLQSQLERESPKKLWVTTGEFNFVINVLPPFHVVHFMYVHEVEEVTGELLENLNAGSGNYLPRFRSSSEDYRLVIAEYPLAAKSGVRPAFLAATAEGFAESIESAFF